MAIQEILVVDPEADSAETISAQLKDEGFYISRVQTAEQALSLVLEGNNIEVIIVDLVLPGISGLELCRILRNHPKTENLPIVILSSKKEENDKILSLEIGADEYITKPFSPRELVARMRALIRRTAPKSATENVLKLGDIVINTGKYTVSIGERVIKLSAIEFDLLRYLAGGRGNVFNRAQLLKAVWKDKTGLESRTVDVHIRRLRERIEDDPSHPRYIKTRNGIGYYFEAGIY